MVDALCEARRVLKPCGILIDVRPVHALMAVEVIDRSAAIWTQEVDSCTTAEDLAASDAAVEHSLSCGWFSVGNSVRFDLDILCDTASELSVYATSRKLRETEIPYDELEARRLVVSGRLRCRRRWMLRTYCRR